MDDLTATTGSTIKNNPDFIKLEARVAASEVQISTMFGLYAQLNKLSSRLERFLIGGWDEESGNYVEGIDSRLKDVATTAAEGNRIAKQANHKFSWLIGGVWTVVAALATDVLSRIDWNGLLRLLPH